MKKILIACGALLFSLQTFADYKYDQAKVSACFDKVKTEILQTKQDAKNIRMGLSTRFDGFTNILVTYSKGTEMFMDVFYIQFDPCATADFVSEVKLINNKSNHARMLQQDFPDCHFKVGSSVEDGDWLFPGEWARNRYSAVKKFGDTDAPLQLGTWIDKRTGKHLAIFRSLRCSPAGGSSSGPQTPTVAASAITGVECTDSECVLKQQ
ncbi:MAG: hypothetical protein COT74_13605 [Bdellovibrionales bacterium CG10_big_fil_rev_8_21_14_0_10_45_34]|nr:MAG: hypothetical protein COT74_13605 [Bdellovibrionales bacterium CG10_big_fil_rev_8_21_14_0_10_45_34]